MSFERFIQLLQMLITMTNPYNEEEILNARNILKNLLELARSSGTADPRTIRAMSQGYHQYIYLLGHRNEIARRPDDTAENRARRRYLAMMLRMSR